MTEHIKITKSGMCIAPSGRSSASSRQERDWGMPLESLRYASFVTLFTLFTKLRGNSSYYTHDDNFEGAMHILKVNNNSIKHKNNYPLLI